MASNIEQSAFDFSGTDIAENSDDGFNRCVESPIQLPMQDACVTYFPNFLCLSDADTAFSELQKTLDWSQDDILLFGKKVKIPRLQAWHGDGDARYMYSGLMMQPKPWTNTLYALKSLCDDQCDVRFNSVLANLYRDGADSMGMHSDDEPELGLQPTIASLTLGAGRNFIFKHKLNKQKYSIELKHGSLLVMKGRTQQYWQHGINKTKRVSAPRINLTFRHVNSQVK